MATEQKVVGQVKTEENDQNRLSMVIFSGDMDKVMAAFIIATGAAAAGKEVNMFFTFWGLKAIQKGTMTGRGLMGRMMGLLNRGGIERIGPSRFNFFGAGRWMLKRMMKANRAASLPELMQVALDLGVKLTPCTLSMEIMEIGEGDLIKEIQPACGVATFLEGAFHSKVTLFI